MLCLMLQSVHAQDTEHFITNIEYRTQVEKDFNLKKSQLPRIDWGEVFDKKMSVYEREAMQFLYAYMVAGDITDYSSGYYLWNIRQSERAQREMPWGESIPEDVFRHFVLPVRVNNEALDSARGVIYYELKERIKGMNLHDAALEVNHWCHEKATYQPSDARTSAPLATIKTAFGRCGEESTLLVAALRTMCIPARQVYVPRWAHTDDNHAWVEVWIDGKWHFMGACEPEAVLDLGWFNTPASRSLLMHSKVFGRYFGDEDVIAQTSTYTEINVTRNYAPVSRATINVIDTKGNPVKGAKVEFKIYNYAEFFTAVTRYSSADGSTWLSAGQGDMLVWASKNGAFGLRKVSFGKDSVANIVLDKHDGDEFSLPFNIVPPTEHANIPTVTLAQRTENNRRLAREDSIRNAYVETMIDSAMAAKLVKRYYLSMKVVPLLMKSRGNWGALLNYIARHAHPEDMGTTSALLMRLSEKDLRDVSEEVLEDRYTWLANLGTAEFFHAQNIWTQPRIADEMLTPYRHFFRDSLSNDTKEVIRKDPVRWCNDNITIDNEINNQGTVMSPVGVWRARVADEHSRDVFFVALTKNLEMASYINPITGKVMIYRRDTGDRVVDFDQKVSNAASLGTLVLNYSPSELVPNPKYYTHFTLSKFEDGTFRLLNYDETNVSWENTFRGGTKLDEGYYMLTSGTRLSGGSVLSEVKFFNIKADETTNIDLDLRKAEDNQLAVIGLLDANLLFKPLNTGTLAGLKSEYGCTNGGYYIVGIIGAGDEPTNHALRDIAALSKEFNAWGQRIILLFADENNAERFNANDFTNLPSTVSYGVDVNNIRSQIISTLDLPTSQLPIFVIASTNNEIVFKQQGYTIGLGEQLMDIIKRLPK